ncbi:hypothetical protein QWY84_05825 [Aquisalimonas lutea]|uniref:hypothetical protein n=1 Tax=Aquisalimonas lutea TaxID=1327750 RepID=UPI0025B4F18A|nr:hypothetical protein [Aquisalimonas lutea]MDN3517123.1 hypothetical protein [Aquisalimonas lutea]
MNEHGRFTIPADHPCLPGHFPGDPVVPGVVLLDHALAAIRPADSPAGLEIARVKFRRPVRPQQAVAVEAGDPDGHGRVVFRCRVEGDTVVEGMVRSRAAADSV